MALTVARLCAAGPLTVVGVCTAGPLMVVGLCSAGTLMPLTGAVGTAVCTLRPRLGAGGSTAVTGARCADADIGADASAAIKTIDKLFTVRTPLRSQSSRQRCQTPPYFTAPLHVSTREPNRGRVRGTLTSSRR